MMAGWFRLPYWALCPSFSSGAWLVTRAASLADLLADGGERLVGRLEHEGEVGAGHGGRHEPVVPWMQVGTTTQGLRGEHVGELVVLVPGEGEKRHHRRTGVLDRQLPRLRLRQDPLAQRRAPALN